MASATKPVTILIAGAGPVGLALAALLVTGRAAERVRVQVLEPRALPRFEPARMDLRVYALSRASQRILQRVGVWQAMAATRVSPYRHMHVWEGDDPEGAASLDFDSADIGEPDLGHIVEDALLRARLLELIESFDNAAVATGAELAGITVQSHEVIVQLRDGGAAQGALLVAADGADSPARTLLELPAMARSYGQKALVTHVASERPHAQTAWQRFLPGGPLAFLPLADGRSSVVWSLPTLRADALLAAGEGDLLAALLDASGGVLGALTSAAERAAFPLQVLHALRYCRARVALAGDAAHAVHPLAGQGMNLGLLDAACLARVLEHAILAGEDPGDLKVLRRYERERKADNLEMVVALDALHGWFALPGWSAPVRRLGLQTIDGLGPAKRWLMRRALGLDTGINNLLPWSQAEGKHRIGPHDIH